MKTLIRNVKLFDGTALAPRPMDVLFDESGILAVKEAGAAPAAADAVVDGTGKTLTPGLIDGHVHLGSLSMSSPTDPKGHTAAGALIAAQVQDLRRWGITAVRNCGTGVNADLVVRDMIRDGLIDGARIVGCGRCICITGGHAWPMGIETDTVDETRKAARLQLREGADFVKLMATGGMGTKGSVPNAPQLTEAQMRAAAEEAASVGKFTAAHCTGLAGAMNAIRAGVNIIEHAQLDEPTAEALARSGAAWCPTIVVQHPAHHRPRLSVDAGQGRPGGSGAQAESPDALQGVRHPCHRGHRRRAKRHGPAGRSPLDRAGNLSGIRHDRTGSTPCLHRRGR